MKLSHEQTAIALISGAIFGFGLSLSGMLNPQRVRGFLDIFGAWDPSLAFVLAGAVAVAALGIKVMRLSSRPVLEPKYHVPSDTKIDAPLIVGSAIFGIGWGLGGLCPGPAVALLSVGLAKPMIFVLCMIAGMQFHDRLMSTRPND